MTRCAVRLYLLLQYYSLLVDVWAVRLLVATVPTPGLLGHGRTPHLPPTAKQFHWRGDDQPTPATRQLRVLPTLHTVTSTKRKGVSAAAAVLCSVQCSSISGRQWCGAGGRGATLWHEKSRCRLALAARADTADTTGNTARLSFPAVSQS